MIWSSAALLGLTQGFVIEKLRLRLACCFLLLCGAMLCEAKEGMSVAQLLTLIYLVMRNDISIKLWKLVSMICLRTSSPKLDGINCIWGRLGMKRRSWRWGETMETKQGYWRRKPGTMKSLPRSYASAEKADIEADCWLTSKCFSWFGLRSLAGALSSWCTLLA